jgi:ubiquinone biosynthesis protein COQ4
MSVRVLARHLEKGMQSCSTKLLANCLSTASKSSSASSSRYFEPYRLSPLQRAFLVPYFAVGAISDPERGDLVAGLGDATGLQALRSMHSRLLATSEGRILLQEKPLLNTSTIDLTYLKSLPSDTFGYQYALFMEKHGFSPDERSQVRFMDNANLAYVMTRYRQVHDFWHVLFDLPISVLGEVTLKWFEYHVTGLPVCYLSGVFGPAKLSMGETRLLLSQGLPWAKAAASDLKEEQLLTFKYENYFNKNIDDVRKILNIVHLAPKYNT